MRKKIRNLLLGLFSLFPKKIARHYLRPFFMVGKTKESYRAKEYFESWHRSTFPGEFSDRITISPGANPLHSKFHYNATENSIIRYLNEHEIPAAAKILDIGSGTGHWIDFYKQILNPVLILGNEISEPAVRALERKYSQSPDVRIIEKDISEAGAVFENTFDIINAIGVLFHVVEDDRLEQAIRNMESALDQNGIILAGGQFGLLTRNVQFNSANCFSSWEESTRLSDGKVYINKRIRSLRFWKKLARRNGLVVDKVIRTQQSSRISTPENHILVLKHETKQDRL